MRVTNSEDANIIISAATLSHSERWDKIENTEAYLMEYKQPFSEEERKKHFISWSNNWNFGKGRMLVEKGVMSNVTEIFKTLGMMEIVFKRPSKKKDAIYQFLETELLRSIFGRKIAEVFADILEQDPRFQTFLCQIEYLSYVFGFAPIIRDKFNYLGNPISHKSIAFEDGTTIDDIRNYVVFDTIKAEILLQRIKESERFALTPVENRCDLYHIYENGWVKEGIEEIFYNLLSNNDEIIEDVKTKAYDISAKLNEGKLEITSWEDVEIIREKKGETWINININNIDVAKIFTTDGSEVTETYIVATQSVAESGWTVSANKYLLYQKNHGEIPYTDRINIVKEFAVSNEKTIHSLRGSSKQITEESMRYDFKRNSIEDKLLLTGNLLVQAKDDLSNEDIEIKVFGGLTILPPNASIPTGQIRYDLNDHIQSIQSDDNDFRSQTSHYNPQISLSNRPTKDEVQLQGAMHTNQKNAKTPFKLRDYSILFTCILNDLIKEEYHNPIDKAANEKFFSELEFEFKEFGIDKSDIKKILAEIECVQLYAVNNDIQSIQAAMPFAQNSNGRTRLQRSFLMALGFSRQDVNIFIEVVEYGHQIEQAALENSAFYNTSEVVFDSSQDNIGHLNIHYPKIDRMIRGIQGGEDIVAGFNYITNALTNTEKHVEAIRTSRFFKNRYREFKDIQKQFEKVAKQISDIINKKKQENAQSGQQGMGIPPEELRKIQILEYKAQKKEERTNALTAAAAQRKAADFQMKIEMKKREADENTEIKKQLATVEADLKRLKEASKLAQQ